ncbi:PRC-barrel domain-containing protein [Rhizobiaceae bacterium BDR2-2]|uniref:PRC-barrel domain-containing protein n=1 Tax=Ectorhizobium quercum TaxID=2965071 RepID=A0AAE3MYD8_9HYPH|nr:PRC-barrel domain-containing protein [Ectorhizobium quercum]MCX8996741.1 PRC-barrel domain-containing protein [Ectorhizobium quercum]
MRRIALALAATAAMVSFAHAQTPTTATTSEVFVVAKPTDVLSYNLVGLNITNPQDETIGEIRDLIISDGLLSGYIVSVGGFLGIGEKYVIVSPASVDVVYSEPDNKWSARIDTTKEALQSAPEFKYEGRWAK